MAYDADIRLIEDYVRVEVVGERRLGDAAHDAGEVGKDIVRFCRANDVFRVMVVLRLRGRLSAVDSYEMVVNSKSYGWTHNFRLAFVENGEIILLQIEDPFPVPSHGDVDLLKLHLVLVGDRHGCRRPDGRARSLAPALLPGPDRALEP